MSTPSVLIAILNWHSAPATLECLAAVRRSRGVGVEVLVVDNGSTDGSAEVLSEVVGKWGAVEGGEDASGGVLGRLGGISVGGEADRDDVVLGGDGGRGRPGDAPGGEEEGAIRGVHFLGLPANTGYAGGMNAALRWAAGHGAEYVLLLTPDALVGPDTIAKLLAALEGDRGAGVAGPVVVYREGPERLVGAGGAIDRGRVRADLHRSVRGDEPYGVDWIDGCCMLVRREVVEGVGGFDEGYFLYFEETDLCARVGAAGWRVLLVPDAEVLHEKDGAPASYYYYYMNRNRYYFWRKNFGVSPARVALSMAGETFELAASWGLSLLIPSRRQRRAGDGQRLLRQLRGGVAGARDFARGRMGRAGVSSPRP